MVEENNEQKQMDRIQKVEVRKVGHSSNVYILTAAHIWCSLQTSKMMKDTSKLIMGIK